MEMLLMGACLSLFGLAVVCLAFGAATRNGGETEAPAAPVIEEDTMKAASSERFFGNLASLPAAARTSVPIEALLLAIENHVRLEQAAAECFVEAPNAARLHSRTISALMN